MCGQIGLQDAATDSVLQRTNVEVDQKADVESADDLARQLTLLVGHTPFQQGHRDQGSQLCGSVPLWFRTKRRSRVGPRKNNTFPSADRH